MFNDFLILILGLCVLVFAADQFLNGTSRLAERFKIPKALVGALLVGFGTSTPELAASLTAVFQQEVGGIELAVGNGVTPPKSSNAAQFAHLCRASFFFVKQDTRAAG